MSSLVNVIVWMFSLGVMTPRLFFGHMVTIRNRLTNTLTIALPDAVTSTLQHDVCVRGFGPAGNQVDTALNFVVTYLTPCLVMLFCVFYVACKKYPHVAVNSQSFVYSTEEVAREVKRQTALVVLVGVIFAIGWLPMHLSDLSAAFGHDLSPLHRFIDHDIVVLLFAFSANALCPIVYLSQGKCFKEHVSVMFCGGRHKLVDTNEEEGNRLNEMNEGLQRTLSLV